MRFKTELEFLKEYGAEWRECLEFSWKSPAMDYYFGRRLTQKQLKQLRRAEFILLRTPGDEYPHTVTLEMLIDDIAIDKVVLSDILAEIYLTYTPEAIIEQCLIDLREKEAVNEIQN